VISSNGNSTAQKFKYNGIELEESLGLNLYEMDVRTYDPAIARFNGIDPVTHHSQGTSVAFDNNPIFWADPSGADAGPGPYGSSCSSCAGGIGNPTRYFVSVYDEDGKVTETVKTTTGKDGVLRNSDGQRVRFNTRLLSADGSGNVSTLGNKFDLNINSGDVSSTGDTDDNFDDLTAKNDNGDIQKVVNNIPQGILKHGMNFRTQNNLIHYGGTGQPSLDKLSWFMKKLHNIFGTEISGYGLGSDKYSAAGVQKTSALLLFGIDKYKSGNRNNDGNISNNPVLKFNQYFSDHLGKHFGIKLHNARYIKYHVHTEPGGDREQSASDKYFKLRTPKLIHYFIKKSNGKMEKY
jgi:RHS repeat-associated protein